MGAFSIALLLITAISTSALWKQSSGQGVASLCDRHCTPSRNPPVPTTRHPTPDAVSFFLSATEGFVAPGRGNRLGSAAPMLDRATT